jgi:S1-C subfamily serine protease
MMDEGSGSAGRDGTAGSPVDGHARSPWPKVVLVLGMVLVVAAGAVAAVALWPRESVPLGSVEPSETPAASASSPAPTISPVSEPDLSAAELARLYGDAVWLVDVDFCGQMGSGTAFAVGPRTLITNAHVVAYDAAPTLSSRDGRTSVRAVVVGADADLDVAVLVTDEDLPGESLAWVGADDLSEGEGLVALGYPVPDSSFTVTPATLMSFQTDGTTRQALRLDGLVDMGNSGGPALTSTGQVAGVVTQLVNEGYQWIGVAFTYDYLAGAIESIERDRPGHVVSCDDQPSTPVVPDGWDPDPDGDVTGPDRYGDDAALDLLYEACRDGDMSACDDLYWQSPYSSEYESFAMTCGGAQLEPVQGDCWWYADDWDDDPVGQGDTYGDDPYLDELWDACAAGDLVGCDTLYYDSPVGTDYESFGASCGDTGAGYGECWWQDDDSPESSGQGVEYGDDPYLDELWDACDAGDLDSCDTLYYESPIDSDYESFAATCGGHVDDPWPGLCEQE